MNTLTFPLATSAYPQPKLSSSRQYTKQSELEAALQIAGISILTIDMIRRKIRFSVQHPSVCNLPVSQDISIPSVLSQITEEHQQGLLKVFRNTAINHKELDYEFEIKTTATPPKWLRITGNYQYTCDGNTGYFLCLLTDVSIKKRNDVRRNELLAMLNHDLRTPLTTIKLYMQMFAKLALNCEHYNTADLLCIASRQVDAMTKMMEDFLETTVLESGKIKINRTAFEVNSLISAILNTEYIQSVRHQFQVNCPEKIWLDADKDKITQVLNNYLSNAVKCSLEGTVISISTKRMPEQIVVSVKDNGIGISADDQKKLFTKFFRSENIPVQKLKGYGIGLYLVNDIIEQHGGKTWANSTPGAGSTFYFSLPV
jgi:signal transduction histidine kinase